MIEGVKAGKTREEIRSGVRELTEYLQGFFRGFLLPEELMAKHTTWRIGGPADLLVRPLDEGDLSLVLQTAAALELPVTIIGNGSNLLVSDLGVPGVVVKIAGTLTGIKRQGEQVWVGAGELLPRLSLWAAGEGLGGLEFGAGIPSSLGGAVAMNAGAHGQSLGDVVLAAEVMDLKGNPYTFDAEELQFSYRHSRLQTGDYIVTLVHLGLKPGDPALLKERMAANLGMRKEKQPLGLPNAGSVFKNPPGDSAGRLIEKVGAKGWRVGDAQVSEVHANFIVNLGQAKAEDVYALICRIRDRVRDSVGIGLELEIRMVGEGVGEER